MNDLHIFLSGSLPSPSGDPILPIGIPVSREYPDKNLFCFQISSREKQIHQSVIYKLPDYVFFNMGLSLKTGAFLTVTCLTIAVAFLVLAGCVTQGGDTPVIPGAADTITATPPGSVSPAEPVPPAGQALNLTIHSAQKFRMNQGTAPANNGVWVVVDLSIENRGFPGEYLLIRDAITLTDPQTGQRYLPEPPHRLHLTDEWNYRPIAFTTSNRGELLFVTNVAPDWNLPHHP